MELRIQKSGGKGVIHAGHWSNDADGIVSECGSGQRHIRGALRSNLGWWELPTGTAVTCKRCLAKLGEPEPEPEADTPADTPQEQDPTVAALVEAGYSREAYSLAEMAEVVRGWLADDVDPFTLDGLIDFIAERHKITEGNPA